MAIKASIFEDFVKAANVLRLVSIIRGPEGHDEETDVSGQTVSTQLESCSRSDANSFEGTVCHVEEMNNYVDPADTPTSTREAATTTTEATTTANTSQLEASGTSQTARLQQTSVHRVNNKYPNFFSKRKFCVWSCIIAASTTNI